MRITLRRLVRSLLLSSALLGPPLVVGHVVQTALGQQPATVPAADPATQPPVLPETTVQPPPVTANISDGTGTILDGTIFSSPPVFGYRAESSTTGTIINVPDADLPATVNVVPRAILDDQIILSVEDFTRDAPGIISGGDLLFADRIFLRGLEVGARNYRKDGFLDPTFVPRDFQNVERVEILKGPASVLYGAGDPAGLVNVITKKPVADKFADFGFMYGSFEDARYTLDINGYGTSSGNVLYRLNIAQEDSQSYRDFGFLSRTQIAPVVTWLIDDSTTLTWNGEWHRDKRRGDLGVPAVGGDPLFLPPSTYVGEPANDFLDTEEFRQSLVLTHELNDDWWFSLGGSSLFFDYPSSTTAATGIVPPIGTFFFRQRNDGPVADENSQSVIANLAGEFCTGELYHKALVGLEYNYYHSNTVFNAGLLPPINVLNPVYTNPPAVPLFGLDSPHFQQQRFGGYLQDLVEINNYWQVLAGVRFDTVDFDYDRTVNLLGIPIPLTTDEVFNHASPRVGVVYQPGGDDILSLYFSYSQSFTPPGGGAFIDFAPIMPVLGESHEAGVKTELLPGLSLAACGFHTTRANDTFNLGPGILTQVGEVRSQGAEVNLLGDITDQWSVIANYTYTDARIFDPDPALNNNRVRNVPFNTANLWTRYNFIDNECQTVGAAIGIVHLGDRPANLSNTLDLPSFVRWDAGIYWCRGPFKANVYLENLTDIQYATASIDEFQIFPGAPFNVRASLSYLY